MPWLQLRVVTGRNDAEAVEDAMLGAGAVSVTLTDHEDNPILEPGVGETPLWEQVNVTGLFEADAPKEDIAQQLNLKTADHNWEQLEDQPWERAWMDQFEPICCGERLWICPSWKSPPDAEAVNLILDPGLAFGTGTHPTTFLCLQWLDGLDLEGKTVVDYGCGSGILGIAALLLGASKVVAIDNDPQALLATRENLHRNNLDDRLLVTCMPDAIPGVQADVVIANILAGPLVELAESICHCLVRSGKLALSGIMTHQIDAVKAAYPDIGFEPVAIFEDWARLNGIKTG